MGNATWICFDCREATRRNTMYRGNVPCPKCSEPMRYLGYKIPVPPKRSLKRWQALRDQLNRQRQENQENQRTDRRFTP